MKPVTTLILIFLSLSTTAQSYNHILEKYEQHEETNPDSALYYAFQLHDAALREYGIAGEAKYFKALNSIGWQYFARGQYDTSLRYFHHSLGLMNQHGIDDYPYTKSFTTEFLYRIKLHRRETDSAIFYADEMLRQDLRTEWGAGRARINALVNVAVAFDTTAGYPYAKKYYQQSLSERAKLFGQNNAALTATLDSLLQLRTRDYYSSARYVIYSVAEQETHPDSLAILARNAVGDEDWTALQYASFWKDELALRGKDTSADYQAALVHLADGFRRFLFRPDISAWMSKQVIQSLEEQQLRNSELYLSAWRSLTRSYQDDNLAWEAIHAAEKFSALSLNKHGKDSEPFLRSLLWLGELHRVRCNIDDSCARLSLAVINEVLRSPLLEKNKLLKADALYQKATTFIRFADLDSAEVYYLGTYPIYESEKAPLYSIAKQLYYVNFYQHDFSKMQAWLKQCIRIAESDPNMNRELVDDLQSLLMISLELRDWKQAEQVMSRYRNLLTDTSASSYAYQTFIKYHIELEKLKGNFNGLDKIALTRIRELSDTTLFYQDTDESRRGIASDLSMAYNQLSEIYYGQGRFEASLSSAYNAWHYSKTIGYDSIMANADIFRSIAKTQYALGKKDSAIWMGRFIAELFRKEQWGQTLLYFRNQLQLSQYLAGNNQLIAAETMMHDAVEALRHDMVLKMGGYNERQRSQYSSLLRESVDQYLDLHRRLITEGNTIATERAYETVIRSKGILLQTSLTRKDTRNDTLQALQRQLTGLRTELAKLHSAAGQGEKRRLDSVTTAIASLEEKISLQSNSYAAFLQDNKVNANDVRKSLRDGEAAVEFTGFHYYDDARRTDSVCYGAFIIRPGLEKVVYIPLNIPGELSVLVNLQSASRGLKKEKGKEEGAFRKLYNITWSALESHLEDVKTIFLSTDGVLNKVAFAALKDSTDSYLADRYQLLLVSNTKDLARYDREAKLKNTSIALFGGAQFERSAKATVAETRGTRSLPPQLQGRTGWAYLPGTLREVQRISKVIRSDESPSGDSSENYMYTDKDASEAKLKALDGKGPSILHIATHGFYFPPVDSLDDSDPLFRSGIVMAGANHAWLGNHVGMGEEDGIVTAFELSNLDLQSTTLAVLSACETGIGDVVNGEGVYGLQRALKNAGVRFMIVSLWPVPDAETAEMMEYFYKALMDSRDIRGSFRIAQTQMRKKYGTAPGKWGAFVLVE